MTEGAGRERWLRHYRELVLGELPHRAGERRVVTEDHCFWSHRPRHGCRRLLVRRAGPAADPRLRSWTTSRSRVLWTSPSGCSGGARPRPERQKSGTPQDQLLVATLTPPHPPMVALRRQSPSAGGPLVAGAYGVGISGHGKAAPPPGTPFSTPGRTRRVPLRCSTPTPRPVSPPPRPAAGATGAPGHELLDLVEHRVLVAGGVEMVLAGNHHGARTGDARGHGGTAMAGSAARPDFETRSAHRGSAVTTFERSRRALALC